MSSRYLSAEWSGWLEAVVHWRYEIWHFLSFCNLSCSHVSCGRPFTTTQKSQQISIVSAFLYLILLEPFDRSNTARSCCDERIFDRIKTVFAKSWRKLRDTNDLNSLFCEQFAPPQYNQYYDNYVHTPIPVYPPDYPLRTF